MRAARKELSTFAQHNGLTTADFRERALAGF